MSSDMHLPRGVLLPFPIDHLAQIPAEVMLDRAKGWGIESAGDRHGGGRRGRGRGVVLLLRPGHAWMLEETKGKIVLTGRAHSEAAKPDRADDLRTGRCALHPERRGANCQDFQWRCSDCPNRSAAQRGGRT